MTDGLKIGVSTTLLLAAIGGAQLLSQRQLQSIDRRLGENSSAENINALEIERLRNARRRPGAETGRSPVQKEARQDREMRPAMREFVRWKCPSCAASYRLPAGKTPPAACPRCRPKPPAPAPPPPPRSAFDDLAHAVAAGETKPPVRETKPPVRETKPPVRETAPAVPETITPLPMVFRSPAETLAALAPASVILVDSRAAHRARRTRDERPKPANDRRRRSRSQ